jgi:predicted DNA-binding protein
MNDITLSHLNPALLEKLEALAKQHNRSLEEEIESILEKQIQETENTFFSFETAWKQVDQARQQHSQQIFSDSVELLREDRQR